MRWGIFARNGFEGAEAFRQGILEIGHQAKPVQSASDYTSSACFEPFDLIVLFGLHWHGVDILRDYTTHHIPVVVVDYGYLKRTNHAHDWRVGHWQTSINGLNRLSPLEDPTRFNALSIEVAERGGDPDGYILLCVQTVGDASHGRSEKELQQWCDEQANQWPGLLIRPHPLQAELTYGLPVCPAKTLNEALAGARLVVTGNSNTGNDCLRAGVPVIATFPGAAWADLSGPTLPSLERRLRHFRRCANSQWTWAEFRTGVPQRSLLNQLGYCEQSTLPLF